MVGFFETAFSTSISTPIPADISIEHFPIGVEILQDYENIARFSSNCKSCRRVPSKASKQEAEQDSVEETQYWEITEDLPFIPSWLWSGGTTYTAIVRPNSSGCEVIIRASSLYTSTSQWRVVRGTPPAEDDGKDPPGPKQEGSEWYIQTTSDAVCNKTFAGFVKGNVAKGTRGMHEVFIEQLRETIERKGGS